MITIFKPQTAEHFEMLENKYQKLGYRNMSGGPMSLMNMDKKIYNGVKAIIIKFPGRRNYYCYYVNEKSFLNKGHRYL